MDEFNWRALLWVFLAMAAIGFVLSLALLAWVLWRVRKIQLPVGADVLTALRMTPLAVVILLDLLDLSLDIFSAPVSWTILSYLGLSPLRGVTVVEGLIPGTQLLPTMTLAWLAARWLERHPPSPQSK
jgi:hypothetical protein